MDADDRPIGRILTRREVLALLGISAATLLTGCGAAAETPASNAPAASPVQPDTPATFAAQPELSPVATLAPTATPIESSVIATTVPTASPAAIGSRPVPACVVRPEQTEGPYFVDTQLNRSDIRSDPASGVVKEGLPLLLTFVVSQVGSAGCAPLSGALVDIWHCDAQGVYSGVRDPRIDTRGQQWLRGYQMTGADGVATFTTIYPGWYPGRTVHIHFKIRATNATGQVYDFTSQLYFDDAISNAVFVQAPYADRGRRATLNQNDSIFRQSGSQLMLNLTPLDQGYAATFEIGVDLGEG
ncbi:intradiol ring-cleavage dioxygenase [Roseiflexus castenholzii]|uniref:intradiol ring-cleavage dioxygenase n=1 Tax=Roseiflexus castenholzii TaxID=120962 RepID=UPI003C7A13EF